MITRAELDRRQVEERELSHVLRKAGACEECGTAEGVITVHAMTAYHFEGEPNSDEDPNRDRSFCHFHAAAYREHWQAMWDEYNASRG